MASVVGICNQAIARTGQTATIAALTEASVAARQCNAHWEQVRDEVLQAFPWGCSTKRVLLSLIDEELVTNWQYCYSYPSDALRIFSLVPAHCNPSLEESVPYEVATYSGLKVILSDQFGAEAVYAWRQTDTAQYPPLLVKAMVAVLAARIAPGLGKAEMVQGLEALAQRALHEAAQADMNESNPGPMPDCDLIRARE